MNLTWGVVGMVLGGALLHASWNALVKSSNDKALDTVLMHVVGSILALPPALIVAMDGSSGTVRVVESGEFCSKPSCVCTQSKIRLCRELIRCRATA